VIARRDAKTNVRTPVHGGTLNIYVGKHVRMNAESKMYFYIRRLRWLMVAVFLVGISVQLAGQPEAFWKDPRAVVEGKPSVRFVLSHGVMPYVLCCAAYIGGAFWLASRLPGRAAQVFVVGMTLVH